jgi:hypothetical protein
MDSEAFMFASSDEEEEINSIISRYKKYNVYACE